MRTTGTVILLVKLMRESPIIDIKNTPKSINEPTVRSPHRNEIIKLTRYNARGIIQINGIEAINPEI